MMKSQSDITEPLTGGGGGGDDESQSSQRSGRSLLERIRAQQAREQQQQQPQSIQVPQYNPNPLPQNFAGGGPPAEEHGSTFFRDAWSNISESMETGMAGLQDHGMDDSLLAPSHRNQNGEESYSMIGYFLTFVRDVYAAFLSVSMPARVVIVVILLYIAVKLL